MREINDQDERKKYKKNILIKSLIIAIFVAIIVFAISNGAKN
ncbi:MAG: hypothetical protein PHY08_12615 [Candidatus Cloacimonetes bacterium]|nr:hypothetical protein [Candidatus Cloacimonadota bacterium]